MTSHHHDGSEPHSHDRRWEWRLLLVLGLCGAAFGAYGMHAYEKEHTDWWSVGYHTLQLFVLHAPHLGGDIPWQLHVGRWLTAAVVLTAVLKGLMRVFRLEWWLILSRFRSGHVIICGAGWRGMALVRDFRCAPTEKGTATTPLPREKVIVIEKNPGCEGLHECERLGIPFLVADATDARILKAAAIQKAKVLVAACSDDGTNLEIAIHARQLTESRRSPRPLKCHIHLSNVDLRTMARQKRLLAGDNGKIVISTSGTDVYENSARWLFLHHVLDYKPITPESALQVHLVIIGFGQMGESVLVQAARVGHFANGKRIKVTVADQNSEAEKQFRGRYPQIDQVCDIEFRSLHSSDPAVVALAEQACKVPDTLLTCAVCLPDDSASLALALKLKAVLTKCRSPIRVRMSSRSGMALFLSDDRQHELFGDQITPFGMIEDVCNRKSVEDSDLDELAEKFQEVYLAKEKETNKDYLNNPAAVPWDQLPEDLKDSNRHAADHIGVKLRAIGYHWDPANAKRDDAEPLTEFLPSQLEIMAPMEHARYCAERFLAGWRYAPPPKDLVNKTNPTLVPWKDVPEKEQKKDYDQIMAIPKILEKMGRVICR